MAGLLVPGQNGHTLKVRAFVVAVRMQMRGDKGNTLVRYQNATLTATKFDAAVYNELHASFNKLMENDPEFQAFRLDQSVGIETNVTVLMVKELEE